MEAAGAVFLPAAGDRRTAPFNDVIDIDTGGNYWSSTTDEVGSPSSAFVMEFLPEIFSPATGITRNHGLSVRLVRDVTQN